MTEFKSDICDITFNEEISLEFVEKIYKEILENSKNVTQYFNENQFNIHIFYLEDNTKCSKAKLIILKILKAFMENCQINSQILMFNLLETVGKNLETSDKLLRNVSTDIMTIIVSNYDLFITAGHHKTISQFINLQFKQISKSEINWDMEKIISWSSKYVDVLWKHNWKSTLAFIQNLSDRLLLENDNNTFLYVDAISQLLSGKRMVFNPKSTWCVNTSHFVCNALKEKNVQRCDKLTSKVLELIGQLLRQMHIDWIPSSSNDDCLHNDELFLRNLYLILSTLTTLVMSTSSNNLSALHFQSIDTLIAYLVSMNSNETEQQFTLEAEMMLVSILKRIDEYHEFAMQILADINRNIGQTPLTIQESMIAYLRVVRQTHWLLGKDVSVFVESCGPIYNEIIKIARAKLIDDCPTHIDPIIEEAIIGGSGVATDLVRNTADEGFTGPFLENLANLFIFVIPIVMDESEIDKTNLELGTINFLYFVGESITLVVDERYLHVVESIREKLVDSLPLDNAKDDLKRAVGRFLLEIYSHTAIAPDNLISEECVLDLFLWLCDAARRDKDDSLNDCFRDFLHHNRALAPVLWEKFRLLQQHCSQLFNK